MKVTYLGHACICVEVEKKHLLIDPFITENKLAKDIDVDAIECDYILITHAHHDHIADTEKIAKRTNATIISNPEIVAYFEKKGLRGYSMNIGGSHRFEDGKIKIKMTKAVHSSSFEDGSYGGVACGFIIDNNNTTIYVSGDTALTMDMTIIPHQYKINLAVLPVGNNYTMGVRDAITAAKFVETNHILAVHYDTFDVIKIDHNVAKNKFSDAHKRLHMLEIGQSIDVENLK